MKTFDKKLTEKDLREEFFPVVVLLAEGESVLLNGVAYLNEADYTIYKEAKSRGPQKQIT